MSVIGKLIDESVMVVEVEAGGLRLAARIRRASAGELLEAGAGGLVMPEPPPGQPRARPRPRNTGGVEALVDAHRFQVHLLRACVLAVGERGGALEPCTITAGEGERERPGTRALPVHALPAELAAELANKVLELTNGEGWRQRVASFLGGGSPDARPDVAPVGEPANGVSRHAAG